MNVVEAFHRNQQSLHLPAFPQGPNPRGECDHLNVPLTSRLDTLGAVEIASLHRQRCAHAASSWPRSLPRPVYERPVLKTAVSWLPHCYGTRVHIADERLWHRTSRRAVLVLGNAMLQSAQSEGSVLQ